MGASIRPKSKRIWSKGLDILRLLALTALFCAGTATAEPLRPGSVAFFGMTFIDTSTEGAYNGVRPDETERIQMIDAYIAEDLVTRGFTLADLAPVQDVIDRTVNPADCNYCDVFMARDLGVEYSMVGEVQKVSNLILSMNIVVRDAAEGQYVKGMSVDIRGNNDKSWLRGIQYILKNNIFRE